MTIAENRVNNILDQCVLGNFEVFSVLTGETLSDGKTRTFSQAYDELERLAYAGTGANHLSANAGIDVRRVT